MSCNFLTDLVGHPNNMIRQNDSLFFLKVTLHRKQLLFFNSAVAPLTVKLSFCSNICLMSLLLLAPKL